MAARRDNDNPPTNEAELYKSLVLSLRKQAHRTSRTLAKLEVSIVEGFTRIETRCGPCQEQLAHLGEKVDGNGKDGLDKRADHLELWRSQHEKEHSEAAAEAKEHRSNIRGIVISTMGWAVAVTVAAIKIVPDVLHWFKGP